MRIGSHSESHLVELDDASRSQMFPGHLDLTQLEAGDGSRGRPHRKRGEFSRADRRERKDARDTGRRKVAGTGGEIRAQGWLMPACFGGRMTTGLWR
jgi:hypothetical protein